MEIMERGFGKMTIGGRERGFHVGTYQSKVFCQVRGIELKAYFEELNKFSFENNMENNAFVCDLLYSALKAYAVYKDEEIDFTAEKVSFWADIAGPEEVKHLFLVMSELERNTPKK